MNPSRIAMFGAGNLATHLSRALSEAGYQIVQVYSRTEASATSLAQKYNAGAITEVAEFDGSCDVVILALSDDAIPEVASKIPFSGQLALHTSGSVPLDIFKKYTDHYGVLYPFQTFSKHRTIDFREIPLFIEAGSQNDLANLKTVASRLSAKVIFADSVQRRQAHLAGIFANNFANHFFAVANELVKKTGFSFEILKPLIRETALKAIDSGNPANVQTGPAVRLNKSTVEKHIELLSDSPDLQKLYTFASDSIAMLHHNETITDHESHQL